MNPFSKVKTYKDLLDANVAFLEGKLETTPYHYGPVDEETKPLLEDLIKLHSYGFFSVASQPSKKDKEEYVDKTWYIHGEKQGNWWYTSEQIPCIEGYIPKTQIDEFYKFISKHRKDYYFEVYEFTRRKGTILTCFESYVETEYLRGNFPNHTKYYNITREKSHKDRNQLKNEHWEDYTNLPLRTNDYYDFTGYDNIDNILIPNTYKIVICGKKYGEGTVIDLLLKFYTKAP